MKTFLTSLGLERYCKAFEEGEVDMRAIDIMEESDYANLGVAKVCAISFFFHVFVFCVLVCTFQCVVSLFHECCLGTGSRVL